jgi:hypothetical protein
MSEIAEMAQTGPFSRIEVSRFKNTMLEVHLLGL